MNLALILIRRGLDEMLSGHYRFLPFFDKYCTWRLEVSRCLLCSIHCLLLTTLLAAHPATLSLFLAWLEVIVFSTHRWNTPRKRRNCQEKHRSSTESESISLCQICCFSNNKWALQHRFLFLFYTLWGDISLYGVCVCLMPVLLISKKEDVASI